MYLSRRGCLAVVFLLFATTCHAADKEQAEQAVRRIKPIADQANPLSTELSDEEIAAVDPIAEEVQRQWLKSPRTPLPADSRTPSDYDRTERYNAWVRSLWLEAWREHGKHDPRWDDRVEELLRDSMQRKTKASPPRELSARARKLLAEGCDDPLIRFVIIMDLDLNAGNTAKETVEMLRPVVKALGPDYTPAVAYRIELRYVQAFNRLFVAQPELAMPTVERLCDRMVKLLSGPLDDEQRRQHLQRMTADLNGALNPHAEVFFQKLAAAESADRWMVQMLLARAHVNLAWQKRGEGVADTVTQTGWQGFGEHLNKARSLLLQAWHEHPELPEAAFNQIAVTMGSGGVAGEDPRFWFDRALAADFDMSAAYQALLWALRPRWGGSHEEMLALGRECLATKRFDTNVPWHFHRAVCDILSESTDARDACAELDIYDNYRELIAGSREVVKDDAERYELDSTEACVAWLTGHDDEARRLLHKLGGDVNPNAFAAFHVTLGDARLALSGKAERAPPGERWLQHDVARIRFAPDAKWLLGFDMYARLAAFDMASGGQPIFDLPNEVEGQMIRDVDISPDGDLVAMILMDPDQVKQPRTGTVVLWDVLKGKIRHTLDSPVPAYRLRFSQDGKRLAAGLLNGGVGVWNVETGERPTWGYWAAHYGWVEALAFTADGKHLATAASDWKVMLFDLPEPDDADAKPPTAKAKWGPFAALPVSVAYSPDGKRLLIGHDVTEVWDVAEGKKVRQLPGSRVAYAPDGRTLATGGGELYNAVRVWDAETGEERARMVGGHHYQVTSLVYSPNGKRLLSGSADPEYQGEGVIRCWDLKTGDEIFDFGGCFD
ncbi:MAG TPA: hypothetical protein VHC22_00275 [Pirellulales bacterium]|nr:hypothetical protein [Pirellulales bacterium]